MSDERIAQLERELATLTDDLIRLYGDATEHVRTILLARKIIAGFDRHTQAVERFMGDLHATMVDPCAEGTIKVEEMQRVLLEAARDNRQALADAQNLNAELNKKLTWMSEEWHKLRMERWGNVVATDVFQLLKHEPKYRVILNLLADGQISVGKCAESVAEVAAGCVPNLPPWRGYESELSWKERNEKLAGALREIADRDPCDMEAEKCNRGRDSTGCIGCVARRALEEEQHGM